MALVTLRTATPCVFNIGPDQLWLSFEPGVSTATGFPIAAGTGYEFPKDIEATLYAVSSGTSDVRVLVVG